MTGCFLLFVYRNNNNKKKKFLFGKKTSLAVFLRFCVSCSYSFEDSFGPASRMSGCPYSFFPAQVYIYFLVCGAHLRRFLFYLFHLIFFDFLHPCRCHFPKAKKLFSPLTRPTPRPSRTGFFSLSAAISCFITLFPRPVLPSGQRTFSEMAFDLSCPRCSPISCSLHYLFLRLRLQNHYQYLKSRLSDSPRLPL